MRWDKECLSTGRLFFWKTKDVPKEFHQLAISNAVNKKFGVGHKAYRSVWDMIFSFYVAHNPIAGSRIGVDFTFHFISYHRESKP